MPVINTANLIAFGIKGWREPSRRRREAEPVRSSLLPKEYRVLVRDQYFYHYHDAQRFCIQYNVQQQSKVFSYLPPCQTCSDGLRCVELRCPLLGLDITAKIVLHSRLWSATFTEVFNFL